VLFGGIHCLAWYGDFPTVAELWLWRSAALAVTALPCFALAAVYVDQPVTFSDLLQQAFNTSAGNLSRLRSLLIALFQFSNLLIIPLLYTVARMMLLIQAFMQLRALPPSAYHTVQWTTFIPHI
jgi:hypothetical protein